MDSPCCVYFGCSEPSHFRCDSPTTHASSQSVAAELSSSMPGVCDLPHQIVAKDLPLYEVEAMSLIHGQIARLVWPALWLLVEGRC